MLWDNEEPVRSSQYCLRNSFWAGFYFIMTVLCWRTEGIAWFLRRLYLNLIRDRILVLPKEKFLGSALFSVNLELTDHGGQKNEVKCVIADGPCRECSLLVACLGNVLILSPSLRLFYFDIVCSQYLHTSKCALEFTQSVRDDLDLGSVIFRHPLPIPVTSH